MANRLADALSPYLRQHADNPVDWWEWQDAAFDEAVRRDVPVLLSVGYAACHWCHVMAHESFEDPGIAALLNDRFVSIKVDREERPDVDAMYMAATTAMTGHGATIVGAYFEGTASGASAEVVLAVKIGMTCSWFASTLGCAQAGSRLLYSMGIERVLPAPLARVHRRFRTPYVAVLAFVAVSAAGVFIYSDTVRDDSGSFDGVVETALVCAYTLVAFASWKFLRRIGEHTSLTRICTVSVSVAGAGLFHDLAHAEFRVAHAHANAESQKVRLVHRLIAAAPLRALG